jgi:HK97 family phage major capsid protein
VTSGVSVAARSDLGAVSETDAVTANVSATVNEYAGMVDIGRQLVMRSEPGFEEVMGRMLLKRYQQKVDTEAMTASGTAPHNLGLDNAGLNTVSFTTGTPTGLGLLPIIYEAISAIYTARAGESTPDTIVVSPRRAAWFGFQASTSFPLAQQGQLREYGTQNLGFLTAWPVDSGNQLF